MGLGRVRQRQITGKKGKNVAEARRVFRQQMPHRMEKNACLSRSGWERPLSLREERLLIGPSK